MDARKPRELLLGRALRAQPDRRLVALARDGSEPAQEEIVRRYRAALVRYAGSIVGAAAAEDVVQEAMAKGLTALGRADDDLRLRPWLYAIVRNTSLNHLRDAGPALEELDENYDGVEQPPQALERRERVRSLVGGMRELPRQQREALVKRELEGRSHDEIATALGVSSGAARQLIFRARASLRVGFGSLLPMPLLRWLAEGGGDGAAGVAAGAGGTALAAKAAVAVFAAGAAVTAGVAIDHGARHRSTPPAAEAAVRPAVVAAGGVPAAEPVDLATSSSGTGESGHGGDSSSGHGLGDGRRDHGRGGHGRGESSGPGSKGGGGNEGSDDSDFEESSSHGSPGGSGGDDSGLSHGGSGGDSRGDDGESHGGSGNHHGSGSGDDGGSANDRSGGGDRSGSSSGDDKSGSGGSRSGSGSGSGGSGSSDSGSGTSGGSGSSDGTPGGGSDGSGGSHSGGGSGGGGDDATAVVAPPSPSPAPAPEPVIEDESSGSSGSGGGSGDESSGSSRDLSGGAVSQGSDDPD